MKCEEVLTFLGPLVDNELPTDTTAVVMEHIASCLHCQQEWDAQLFLKRQFQQLDDSIVVSPRGLTLMDKRIDAMSSSPRVRQLLVVAATIIAVGLSCFAWLRPQLASRSATLDQVLQTYSLNAIPANSTHPTDQQLKDLSQHVKFKPAAFDLPGWSLASADVLHLPEHICLLRLVYKSDSDAGLRPIAVYQSCQGQLEPPGLKERVVAGRHIRCGQLNGLTLVHWSDTGRDHLFVSSLSEHELMSLALRV